MNNMENTLDHLLKIEAEAAALLSGAQEEADRRIHENEEKNREIFEERYKAEAQTRESSLKKEIERLKEQYQKEIEDYRRQISGIDVDTRRFSDLFNEFLAGQG